MAELRHRLVKTAEAVLEHVFRKLLVALVFLGLFPHPDLVDECVLLPVVVQVLNAGKGVWGCLRAVVSRRGDAGL